MTNLADRTDNLASFVKRWSDRKLKRADDGNVDLRQDRGLTGAGDPQTASPQSASLGEVAAEFADFDFSSLDFSSDFSRFLGANVPDHVRNRALKALWSSHDTISRPDDLDDYLEDFSEEAMALPAELVKSAYKIGRGFVNDDDSDSRSIKSTTEQTVNTAALNDASALETNDIEARGEPSASQCSDAPEDKQELPADHPTLDGDSEPTNVTDARKSAF